MQRLNPLVPSLLKDSLFLLPTRQELLLHDGDTSTWAPSCLHPFCQEPWGNRQGFDKIPGKWMALPGAWCVAYLSVVRCIYPAFSLLGSEGRRGGAQGWGERQDRTGWPLQGRLLNEQGKVKAKPHISSCPELKNGGKYSLF